MRRGDVAGQCDASGGEKERQPWHACATEPVHQLADRWVPNKPAAENSAATAASSTEANTFGDGEHAKRDEAHHDDGFTTEAIRQRAEHQGAERHPKQPAANTALKDAFDTPQATEMIGATKPIAWVSKLSRIMMMKHKTSTRSWKPPTFRTSMNRATSTGPRQDWVIAKTHPSLRLAALWVCITRRRRGV